MDPKNQLEELQNQLQDEMRNPQVISEFKKFNDVGCDIGCVLFTNQ